MRNVKPLLAFAALLLLSLSRVNGAQGSEFQIAPLNPEFETYAQELLQGTLSTATPEGYGLGHMPPPMDVQALNPNVDMGPSEPLALPTKWDWRSSPGYNAVTPVKNQGSCGSCWSFGNMGAIESNYKIQVSHTTSLNLSENNMIDIKDSGANKYCHWPWIWTRCGGGNTWTATAYLTGLVKRSALSQFSKGALTETSDPYNSSSAYSSTKCTATRPYPLRRINGTRWISNNTTTMKNALYSKGPLVTAYFAQSPGGSHWSSSNTVYHYPGYTGSTNHEVLIVGYDDNKAWPAPSTGKGAWLVKNSWGSFNSMGGYFWLTYGSAKVGSDGMYYTGTRPFNSKENLYMEDLPGWWSNVGCGTSTAYGLDVFAPLNTGERLTHVEFYNPWAGKTYTIKVWGTVTVSGSNATVSGLLRTQNITVQEPGYYTVALTTPVTLTKGHKYGVEMKFVSTGSTYPLPVAQTYTGVVGSFIGNGNSYTYGRCSSTGAFQRLVISGQTMPVSIRARTLLP
jgi:C1A family cysteine protease